MATTITVGLGTLTLGWVAAPHAPALYDGIGFPDEPYRYSLVLADDPVKTPPPTLARTVFPMADGLNEEGEIVESTEVGPQVLIYVPAAAIKAKVASATVTAIPEAPPAAQPADGPIAGDVYAVGITPTGSWVGNHPGTIALRSPQGTPYIPIVEHEALGATQWTAVQTTRTGNDIWTAPISDTGLYALVLPLNKRAPIATSGTSSTLLYAGGGTVGGIALLLLVIRARRTRELRVSVDDATSPD